MQVRNTKYEWPKEGKTLKIEAVLKKKVRNTRYEVLTEEEVSKLGTVGK